MNGQLQKNWFCSQLRFQPTLRVNFAAYFQVKKGDEPILQSNQNVSNALFLIFMGSMDCLTTVVGVAFFGVREVNPVLSGLVSSDLPGFVVLKLTVTIAVGLIFILAQKTLDRACDHDSFSFRIAMRTLKAAYFGVVLFLAIVVVNNILVLLRLII